MSNKATETKITGQTAGQMAKNTTSATAHEIGWEFGAGVGRVVMAFFYKGSKHVKPTRESAAVRFFGSFFFFVVCAVVFIIAASRAMESGRVDDETITTPVPFRQYYHLKIENERWVVINEDEKIELELPIPASNTDLLNDSRSYELNGLRKEIVTKLEIWFQDKTHAYINRQWLAALTESQFGAVLLRIKDHQRLKSALPAFSEVTPSPIPVTHPPVPVQAPPSAKSPIIQEDASLHNTRHLIRWLVSYPPGSRVFQGYSDTWANRNRAKIQGILKKTKVTKLDLGPADLKRYKNALYLQAILKERYPSENISIDGLIGINTVQTMIRQYKAEEEISEQSIKANLCKTLSPFGRFLFKNARRHMGCP